MVVGWFSTAIVYSGSLENNVGVGFTPAPIPDPTLPAKPSQADYGAQAFWLDCMSCHGDQGQGLTAEFRKLAYPPDHQSCWKSHCHGPDPYLNGFILPTLVPRLIGDGALNNFPTAANLHAFISSAMPFNAPGTLSDDVYWQLTAFLLRQNGLWDGQSEINASNATQILIQPAASSPSATPAPNPAPTEVPQNNSVSIFLIITGIVLIILILIAFRVIQNKNKI